MTIVLVHGAGDTARRWRRVQARLGAPSVAVDLLGRGARPYDLCAVTVEAAAAAAVADVRAASRGPWLVVAHSAGSIIAPRLIAELGEVTGLVMVAGMCAPEGCRAIEVVDPGGERRFDERRASLLERYRGHSYVRAGEPDPPDGLVALHDARIVQAIDSLVLMYETVSWAGVPEGMPRTWVRCLRDRIQPPDMQDRIIAASGADRVRDIDTGHTPSVEDPAGLAALIGELAGRR